MGFPNQKGYIAVFTHPGEENTAHIFGPEVDKLAEKALALSGNTEVLIYKLHAKAKVNVALDKIP